MRDLCSIVQATTSALSTDQADVRERGAIGSEPIGDDGGRCRSLLQESPHVFQDRLPISLRLNEHVEHLAFIFDCAPEIVGPTANLKEDLVKMLSAGMLVPTSSDALGVDTAELEDPSSECFVGDVDAALRQEVLDVARTQLESEIEPDCVLDNLEWKAMALVIALPELVSM